MLSFAKASVLAVAVLLAFGWVSGCGSSDSPDGSVSRFAELFRGQTADYNVAGTPVDLAARSDLVIQGHIDGFNPGRVHGTSASDPGALSTVTMRVSVDSTLKGAVPRGADGQIFIEMWPSGNAESSVLEAAAPKDDPMLLYLTELPAKLGPFDEIVDVDAGRPAGQPLFGFTTPQGMLIEDDAANAVTALLEGAEYRGTSLSDFLPSRSDFPENETSVYAESSN
jgi:hypothetical protein